MMELFHGTTHDFNQFSVKCGNPANHMGIGVYLTSCINDVVQNYACLGADLRWRINDLADEFANDDDFEHAGVWSECVRKAREILDGGKRLLLRCEIKPEAKLLMLSKNHWLDLYTFDENDEAEHTEAGLAIQLLCDQFDMENPDTCEMTTNEVFQWIRNVYEGEEYWGQIFKQFVIAMGYDGVEYEDAADYFPYMVRRGTKHFVLYNPEMAVIKSKEEHDLE